MGNPFPYPDEQTAGKAMQQRIAAEYEAVGRLYPDHDDPDAFLWTQRYGYNCGEMLEQEAANKVIAELHAALNPDAPEPPPIDHPNPIVGKLELIDGGRGGLRDANGPRLFQGVHAGDLLLRNHLEPSFVDAALDHFMALGLQFVRSWAVLPGEWWKARAGEMHPDFDWFWPNVHNYAEKLIARGLRWQVSQGDMLRYYPNQHERTLFMRNLGLTLMEHGGAERLVCSVDVGNEAWQNGESYDATPDSVARMDECLAAFLAVCPVPIAVLTSVHDEGVLNEYVSPHATAIAYHQSRYVFRRAIERAFTASYWDGKLRPFLVSDEPVGVNNADGIDHTGAHVSALESPSDWRELEAMGVEAMVHLFSRQLYTCLTSPGVISDEPFSNYPALALAPKIAAMLPSDIQSWRLFHGGENRESSPSRVLAVSGGNVRCDHARAADGRVAVLVYVDAPCHLDLYAVNGFEGVIITPGTLEQFPMSFAKGSRVAIDLNKGRMLLGRVL